MKRLSILFIFMLLPLLATSATDEPWYGTYSTTSIPFHAADPREEGYNAVTFGPNCGIFFTVTENFKEYLNYNCSYEKDGYYVVITMWDDQALTSNVVKTVIGAFTRNYEAFYLDNVGYIKRNNEYGVPGVPRNGKGE